MHSPGCRHTCLPCDPASTHNAFFAMKCASGMPSRFPFAVAENVRLDAGVFGRTTTFRCVPCPIAPRRSMSIDPVAVADALQFLCRKKCRAGTNPAFALGIGSMMMAAISSGAKSRLNICCSSSSRIPCRKFLVFGCARSDTHKEWICSRRRQCAEMPCAGYSWKP